MSKRPTDDQLRERGVAAYIKTVPTWMKQMPKEFEVDTKEGKMKGKAGDYLCVGEEGEMWPLDQAIFKKTYKPITDK
jgi:pyrrolidone-carboxylate peptidase